MEWEPEEERKKKLYCREERLSIMMIIIEAQLKTGIKISEAVSKATIQTKNILADLNEQAPYE